MFIRKVMRQVHLKSVVECTTIYHIAEHRAKRYERNNMYTNAKIEWHFSEQLRRAVMNRHKQVDLGHKNAIAYCKKRQIKIEMKLLSRKD